MKKNISRFILLPGLITAFMLTVIFAFNPPEKTPKKNIKKAKVACASCPSSCDQIMTDCYGGPGCTLPGCTGIWKVPNVDNIVLGVKTVYIYNMTLCHVPSGTPPWTSYTQVCKIMNPTYRPSSTKVVNATTSAGTVFKVTIFPSGDLYIQHFSGPIPTVPAATITFSYLSS
jgi:hypothetical protein